MALNVTPRWMGDICVLEFSGRMTLGPALASLSARTEKEIGSRRAAAVVLHLAAVTHYDSAGLGELLKVYTSTSRAGSRLALVSANQRLREMLAVTHLDGILEHMDRLNEVDTAGVEPMSQVLFEAGETATLRADLPVPPLGNQAALANAPQPGAGYFKVPIVIER